MNMTVKQLAEELGVSKPTISKAITDLGLQGNLHKIGNRFILEDSEISAIKSQIMQKPEPQEVQKSETSTEKQSKKAETDTEKTLISLLESQITILSQQLQVKDNQIAAQQEQIKTLTQSLHDTTAALTAAQALHAGTIQQQLADKQASHEGQAEPDSEERQGFWQRIFKKRS